MKQTNKQTTNININVDILITIKLLMLPTIASFHKIFIAEPAILFQFRI